MKKFYLDRDLFSSWLLIGTAGILALIIVLTDRRDLTSAAVVLSAMVLFLTGIFLFTFTKKGTLDNRIAGLLPTPGTITISQIAADIGLSGNAWFLPGHMTGADSVRQFIPVSSYQGEIIESQNIFISSSSTAGMVIHPAGEVLFDELRTRNNLIVPDTEDALFSCIREVGETLLEVADQVDVTRTGDSMVIQLKNYRLIDGCQHISRESPACCLFHPCPVSSLFGILLAQGSGMPICIDRCQPDIRTGSVTLLFSTLQEDDPNSVSG